jgi:hypothetical protein
MRVRSSSPRRRGLWTCAILPTGGRTGAAPIGSIPPAKTAPSTGWTTTQSSTSRSPTPRPSPGGRASHCPRRPNGSSPRAAESKRPITRGATRLGPAIDISPTLGRESSPGKPGNRWLRGHVPGRRVPRERVRAYDMIGNVWEWTTDWYVARHPNEKLKSCCTPRNLSGPQQDESYDPCQPKIMVPRKVIKGGSHLCAPNYCRRYRAGDRTHTAGIRSHADESIKRPEQSVGQPPVSRPSWPGTWNQQYRLNERASTKGHLELRGAHLAE